MDMKKKTKSRSERKIGGREKEGPNTENKENKYLLHSFTTKYN